MNIRLLESQIICDVVVENENNQMKIDNENNASESIQKARQISEINSYNIIYLIIIQAHSFF